MTPLKREVFILHVDMCKVAEEYWLYVDNK